jgi:hypothetical protein
MRQLRRRTGSKPWVEAPIRPARASPHGARIHDWPHWHPDGGVGVSSTWHSPDPSSTAPCGRLSTTPAALTSLAPGRVSASRREGARGLPRSLAPGPSPGTQPRPRNPATRCGGITDPRRTDHQSHARTGTTHSPSRCTRTARALPTPDPTSPAHRSSPFPRPLRPQLPSRRLDGSPRPAPRPHHRSQCMVCVLPPCSGCRRPAPGPTSTRLGWPARFYLAGRGRESAAQAADSLPRKPRWEAKNRRGAGRRPVRQLGRTARDEHLETNA